MRARALMLSFGLAMLAGCASGGSTPQAQSSAASPQQVAEALAAPGRTDADRERDARDRPADLIALAGFGPGMVIGDVFGGGGYYSEILSPIVGPSGRVLLVNNAPYDNYAKKTLEPRLAGGRLANVQYSIAPNEALGLGTGTLDGALIVMSYHDLYYAEPKEGWPAIDAGQFLDQLHAALKPGATLLIVDHQARPGSGRADTQALHRIEADFAIADFKAHGFDLARSSDILRNPADDHATNVFDPAIRGRTDRFVHVYTRR